MNFFSRLRFNSLPVLCLALGILAATSGCVDIGGKRSPKPVSVLIVGGGSSHDFNRWFNQADVATLQAAGANASYTDQPAAISAALPNLDVLYLSNNQPMRDPQLRRGIFDFESSGHGLLLVHPALWYNWNDWPAYNRVLVGGGARSHDRYGEFEVTVVDAKHPVMAGVPKTFRVSDELYHFERDAAGSPMHVLAEGRNLSTGKTYPIAWTIECPKGRIVCLTLGHDGNAHDHPAYQTILRNSLRWLARQP
ncbi:MAG: ThuA domain-containing protein [Limisphaerales bacterium]